VKTIAAVIALLVALFSSAATAGFEEGAASFRGGDYTAAYEEWLGWAGNGNAKAQWAVGILYASGLGVQRDPQKAAEWYRKAAEQGLPVAEYELAAMYSSGDGVSQDHSEAAKWYRRSADRGFAWAQYRLAVYYMNGRGVRQDYDEAIKWYLEAAAEGAASAMHNLGWMYEKGKGVRASKKEAIKWYRSAADLGHAGSQHNLGNFYARAIGVSRDWERAYFWQLLALQNSSSDELTGFAKLERDTAIKHLSSGKIAEIDKEVAAWKPSGPNPNCIQLLELAVLYAECRASF
jgi:uncharacterized protein